MAGKKKVLKIAFNAPVILAFTIICFLVLLVDQLTGNAATNTLFSVYHSSLLDPLTYVRFVGHVFGHASWEHFIGNITLLLVVGPLLEEKYGSGNMILVIVATAITTGIVNFIFFPRVQLLGASGVVFAMILLASITSIEENTIPLTFILVAVIYIGQQVYEGLFVRDNVSNLTHILGGIVGAVIGFELNRKRRYRR